MNGGAEKLFLQGVVEDGKTFSPKNGRRTEGRKNFFSKKKRSWSETERSEVEPGPNLETFKRRKDEIPRGQNPLKTDVFIHLKKGPKNVLLGRFWGVPVVSPNTPF